MRGVHRSRAGGEFIADSIEAMRHERPGMKLSDIAVLYLASTVIATLCSASCGVATFRCK